MATVIRVVVALAMCGAGCGDAEAVAAGAGFESTAPATPPATTASTPTVSPRFRCPVTVPPVPGPAVPAPYPEQPSLGVWYGTAELWTALDPDGGYVPRKGVFWSANFPGGDVAEQPDLAVTWRRLDEVAPVITAGSPATNAYTAEEGWFMIAGIDPDVAGCWEVTATYRGAELSYVYLKADGAVD